MPLYDTGQRNRYLIPKNETTNNSDGGLVHQSQGRNMRLDYVHRYLSAAFQGLGRFISKYPVWFIIVPLITTGLLSTGFMRATMENRIEYLYIPLNGRTRVERSSIESLFPISEGQDMGRMAKLPPFGSVIATAKDGENMLRESILDEMATLDNIIRKITVVEGNRSYSYSDICWKNYDGRCFPNDGLIVRGKVKDMRQGKFKIKFPAEKDWLAVFVSAYNFGGVKTDEDSYVTEIKAFRLFYVLDGITEEVQELIEKWMTLFIENILQINFNNIKVSRLTRTSIDTETSKITYSVYPILILAGLAMIVLGIVSCMAADCVTSKPWLGVAACVTSLVGVTSAFGMLLLCGSEYVDINIAVVFLMLGIGMDDSFVILSAWRLTNPKDSVEKRMSQSYSESAVSVSITSLTNFLASCSGFATPYRIIQIYSLYSATAVLFVYIVQLTFFGGCLAISGKQEMKNRHSVFCFPMKRHSSKGLLYTILTEGCIDKPYTSSNTDTARKAITVRSFDLLGKALSKAYVKFGVILTFVIYFGISVYGIKNHISLQFDYKNALTDYSYARTFVDQQNKYFNEIPFSFQVVINATLDYSDVKVQKDIEEILQKIESSDHVHDTWTESWLREYINFAKSAGNFWFFENVNISDPIDYVQGLRTVFLKMVKRFKHDVRFSNDETKITASRFILFSKHIRDSLSENAFVKYLWKIADTCKYPVYIQGQFFFLSDISNGIEETSVQCLIVTVVVIIIVYTLFIPNLICSLSSAVTVIFIETGVIGFMSLWNVNFNIVSMMSLIVSVGLCVDYSAHVSYAFISSSEADANKKIRIALVSAGYPVLQGCVSTILGTIVLYAAPMESIKTFVKIIFLVMIFSFFHAVLLIPVLLSLLDELFTSKKCKTQISKLSNKPTLTNAQNRNADVAEPMI